ncbi:MAG: bifunctional (p)ppGpp synthetase/guanosine-3',5'-bis(diphosphate) 3'-pyrophosphohydrolase [Magnetococcales bacterium]|nr:bifunctional (p)ppGpp synthetase/guanosine-3',5'-bis(diphosphate) 3'-pyrophosphohydrolase [Magnetococcales bacterium]
MDTQPNHITHTQETDLSLLLTGIRLASFWHRDQRRRDPFGTPYINHPLGVLDILHNEGGVTDTVTLLGGLLHDTIEDTDATAEELRDHFGEEVRDLVLEVSDDKSLPKLRRKQLQIETAFHKPLPAKLIKLADMIHNLRDLVAAPPQSWSLERRQGYVVWAQAVAVGLAGAHGGLELKMRQALTEAKQAFGLDGE